MIFVPMINVSGSDYVMHRSRCPVSKIICDPIGRDGTIKLILRSYNNRPDYVSLL
jgi:hypothetical protein